jgi:ATP-dependent helicase HrpA
MILAARDEGCMDEVLIIAAALSVQDPRERPMDKQEAADAAHAQFRDEQSDFLAYVKLWDFYHEQARHLSTSKLRKLCQTNFLSFVRMREWHDIHRQLHDLVGEMGLLRGGTPPGGSVNRDVKRDDVKREARRFRGRAPA